MLESKKQRLIEILQFEGISDKNVLRAIHRVPREAFVSENLVQFAYDNNALPIAAAQTISQPYVVAYMTQTLLGGKEKLEKVLEVGTGSGYQAAILSYLSNKVYSIERIKELYEEAKVRLTNLKIDNVFLKYGDGYLGWESHAPYEAIIVTAAAPYVPDKLLEQLAEEGRLVIPINSDGGQILKIIEKKANEYVTTNLEHVIFVPMLKGKA